MVLLTSHIILIINCYNIYFSENFYSKDYGWENDLEETKTTFGIDHFFAN